MTWDNERQRAQTGIVVRLVARVLLVDPLDRVLLVRFSDSERAATWWATPGGGLEARESYRSAARRELREETGLEDVRIGPWIWTRRHRFPSGDRVVEHRERIFLARTDGTPVSSARVGEHERDYFRELRWWSLDELDATDEDTSPRDLAALARAVLTSGPPVEPLVVGT